MATRNVDLHRLCLLPLGTITQKREGDATVQKWVYQRVGKGFGNIPMRKPYDLQMRRHVIGLNPQTVPQQAQRNRLTVAVVAWQALTLEEKDVYNKRGVRGYQLSGYNLFLREHIKKSIVEDAL